MNSKLALTRVYHVGYERVGKGSVMQCFEWKQSFLMQQKGKEKGV